MIDWCPHFKDFRGWLGLLGPPPERSIRLVFFKFFNFYTQQIFGTVNARYPSNGPTQIHQIYRKFIAHTPAPNTGFF